MPSWVLLSISSDGMPGKVMACSMSTPATAVKPNTSTLAMSWCSSVRVFQAMVTTISDTSTANISSSRCTVG